MNGEEDQPKATDEAESTHKLQNAVARLMLERPGLSLAQIFFDYRVIKNYIGGKLYVDLIETYRFLKEEMN